MITRYQDLEALQPGGSRMWLRSKALDCLSLLESVRGDAALARPRVQLIYIHHTFEDEAENLDRLLRQLSKHHEFVSHSEAVRRVLSGRIDAPCIGISSDDGFKNNLIAAEILQRHGIKACFFINPAVVGERDPERIRRHCEGSLQMPPIEFLDWDDVERLLKAGHEIGAHTMTHFNIAAAPEQRIVEDMEQCRAILKQRCGIAEHFAFPFGRFEHFSEVGRRAVFAAGFTSCASAERGCHIATPNLAPERLCLRRDNVVLGWSLRHIQYFLSRSARRAHQSNDLFPWLIP